jgi:hypothetical protein
MARPACVSGADSRTAPAKARATSTALDCVCGRVPPLRSGPGCARSRQRYNRCQLRRAPGALEPRAKSSGHLHGAPVSRSCGRASLTQRQRRTATATANSAAPSRPEAALRPSGRRARRLKPRLQRHKVRLRGLRSVRSPRHSGFGPSAGEAPRSLWGFPQSLRRLQPLRPRLSSSAAALIHPPTPAARSPARRCFPPSRSRARTASASARSRRSRP